MAIDTMQQGAGVKWCVVITSFSLLFHHFLLCTVASANPPRRGRALEEVSVLVTAPPSYAPRLAHHLTLEGARILFLPTIVTEFLDDNDASAQSLKTALLESDSSSYDDYVAFTSRRGIEAAFRACGQDQLVRRFNKKACGAIALGADAEALVSSGVDRGCILTPKKDPTPNGIVSLLAERIPQPAFRQRTRILCPVPKVNRPLTEPSIVPDFLRALRNKGFLVERLDTYQTRWTGPSSDAERTLQQHVNVIAISSTAEVEGLLLLCQHYNVTLSNRIKIVAHGPVTAAGANALGVHVDAVSRDSSSFRGMCDAIAQCVDC